jgi:hypothetical protein
MSATQTLILGNSRVTGNTALLGGGVYLLGERARLDTADQAGHVTTNFAGNDADISTRGTVGTWADVCEDGTICPEFTCGADFFADEMGMGLHSFTFQLNVSAFCGTRDV